MTNFTKLSLLKTRKRIVDQVEQGKLSVNTAANLLGMTRQGLWKLRKRYRQYGLLGLTGRKRGPRPGVVPINKTPAWVEEKIERIYYQYGVGLDTLVWIIQDHYSDQEALVRLSRSTIYRILVRRRLMVKRQLTLKEQRRLKHQKRYVKGYPGEEVQIDTTEPFGKGKGVMLNIIDDYSRWKQSYFYQDNNSLNATLCFQHFLTSAPFPVEKVRTDNGPEFKKHFTKFCQQRGISIIRNPVHTPEHNGKVERLHRTVEEECLWRIPPEKRTNPELVNYHLHQHSQWYNTKRRHLGYQMEKKTPQQKIEQWILNNKTNPFYQGEVNETLILYIC